MSQNTDIPVMSSKGKRSGHRMCSGKHLHQRLLRPAALLKKRLDRGAFQ